MVFASLFSPLARSLEPDIHAWPCKELNAHLRSPCVEPPLHALQPESEERLSSGPTALVFFDSLVIISQDDRNKFECFRRSDGILRKCTQRPFLSRRDNCFQDRKGVQSLQFHSPFLKSSIVVTTIFSWIELFPGTLRPGDGVFERCEQDSDLDVVSLSMTNAASARARAKWLLMRGCERFFEGLKAG